MEVKTDPFWGWSVFPPFYFGLLGPSPHMVKTH